MEICPFSVPFRQGHGFKRRCGSECDTYWLSLSVNLGDWHQSHSVDAVNPAPPNPNHLKSTVALSLCPLAVQQHSTCVMDSFMVEVLLLWWPPTFSLSSTESLFQLCLTGANEWPQLHPLQASSMPLATVSPLAGDCANGGA